MVLGPDDRRAARGCLRGGPTRLLPTRPADPQRCRLPHRAGGDPNGSSRSPASSREAHSRSAKDHPRQAVPPRRGLSSSGGASQHSPSRPQPGGRFRVRVRSMRIAVQQVEIQPDWLTYVTTIGTLIAGVAALLAVLFAVWEARRSREDLQVERRTNFELGLLAQLSEQHSITGVAHMAGHARALITPSASDDDIPVLRAHLGVRPTSAGEARRVELINAAKRDKNEIDGRHAAQDAIRSEVGQEITTAIDRRLGTATPARRARRRASVQG